MPEAPPPRAVLDLVWRVNLIDVGREDARRYLEDLPRRARAASIREQASQIRCPVHGRPVLLAAASGPGGELQFLLSPCCEELEGALAVQLGYQPRAPEDPSGQN
jgi:hypothetical protein